MLRPKICKCSRTLDIYRTAKKMVPSWSYAPINLRILVSKIHFGFRRKKIFNIYTLSICIFLNWKIKSLPTYISKQNVDIRPGSWWKKMFHLLNLVKLYMNLNSFWMYNNDSFMKLLYLMNLFYEKKQEHSIGTCLSH